MRGMMRLAIMGVPGAQGPTFAEWAQTLLDAGVLPLWYRCNEASGTTLTNYGSLGATLNGTLTPGVGGVARDGLLGTGDAIEFDGADTVITVPLNAVFNSPATTQVWLMKLRSAGEANNGYLWSSPRGPLGSTQILDASMASLQSVADTFSTDAATVTSAGLDTNWLLLFRTYDHAGDRKVRLYVGNASGLTELATTTQTASTGDLRPAHIDQSILGTTPASLRSCDGFLDEVMLVTKVLSEAEMLAVISSCPFLTQQGLFNVDDFGAVGDGTTDDAAAINKAIAAAKISSSGGTVSFTSGKNYAIGSAVEVTGDNITLSGYGATLTMLADTNLSNTLHIHGESGARLQAPKVYGLTIDANYALAGGYQKRGLRFEHVLNARAEDVTVKNAYVSLHFDTGSKDSVADSCACEDYYNDGFDAGGTAAIVDEDEPTGITFQNCEASSSREEVNSAWEIEDGAHDITVIDSTTDGIINLRNHDGVNAKTQDILFERVVASEFVIANTYDTATNYVKNVTLRNCTGTVTISGTIEGLVIEP